MALTAHAMREELDRCLAVGMNDYITKPFLEDVLRRKLEHWLGDAGDGPEPERPAMPATLPPLDVARITELRGLGRAVGRDVLGEIAETFQSQAHVTEIRSALARGDWPLLKRSAHALKGSSAVLGSDGPVSALRGVRATAAQHRSRSLRRLPGGPRKGVPARPLRAHRGGPGSALTISV